MIIKRVVVQGFKTYAKKTDFIFDPGVTAIVGPNGSGKSNVADAIRWCLGEQSFSLLRSKKTSDVIFSGSDQKSRLGMAQVTVTMDNSEGDLPVDFAEVEITRRAYRDGNNEYLLNGQRVRLSDITEILAPTGLGKRTYALIGQGLIERVLSIAPEELRSLFEEAAGITSHQAKRSAALRRLEAAQLNLTRVRDITAEISPRLEHLRRQAERAEQRNMIADQLRGMLEDWYGYHWFQARRLLADKGAESKVFEELVNQHRSELEGVSRLIEQQRGEQAQLRTRLSQYHGESSQRHRTAEQIGRELAVAQERQRQIVARSESNRQELAPLQLQKESLEERIAQSALAVSNLEAELATRNQHVDELQGQLHIRQEDDRKANDQIAEQRQRVQQLRTSATQAESRLQQLTMRRSQLLAELDSEQKAHQESTLQSEALIKDAVESESILSGLEWRIQSEIEKRRRTEHEIEEARTRLNEAVEIRQIAERELDRLQTRDDVLKRLQREGAGYANGVQSVLQAAQQNRLSGVLGTVASALDTPAHLDRAIETALGGAYQNIITQTWKNAHNAIEYLTQTGNGRATFLPLDRLHVLPAIPAPAQTGLIGNAAELVRYDDTVKDAIEQLLNRVWIAEDLDAARSALDAIAYGPRPTVVTLHGEIVRPGGAVSGGRDSHGRDDSILKRERELRELPAQIDAASTEAIARAAECNASVARIETLQQMLTPVRENLDALNTELRNAQIKATAVDKACERLAQTVDWHTTRIVQLSAELGDTDSQQASLEAEFLDLRARQEEAETAFQSIEQSADAEWTRALLQQLADRRTAAAEVKGDLQSQTAILENQRRNLQSALNQIDHREGQLAALTTQAVDLSSSIDRLSIQETELSAVIANLQTRITPLEATLAEMEAEQLRNEEKERTLQDLLRHDEMKWNQTQLAAQRAQDAIDQLRRDIEHEFEFVLLDVSDGETVPTPLPVDEIVQRLTPLESLPEDLDEEVRRIRRSLSRLKNVNPDAPREYAEAAERCEFLESQSVDLEKAIADLRAVIAKLDTIMESELADTFAAVSEQFVHYFELLFEGGTAKLSLTDAGSITTSGIEIIARPPGKRLQALALLSGGERTLTACALIFAILRVSPTPFCVLDEVDAALDEANVDRFRFALDELSEETQFILITHNRRTLEGTNAIYGVTMGADGASRVISLKLEGEKIVQGDAEHAGRGSDANNRLAELEDTVEL